MPKKSIAQIIIKLRTAEELAEEYRCVAEELAEECVISQSIAANYSNCFDGVIEKICLIMENSDLPTEATYDLEDLVKDMRGTRRSVINDVNI